MSSLLRVKCGAEMNTCFGGLRNQQDRAWLGMLGGKNPWEGEDLAGVQGTLNFNLQMYFHVFVCG